MPMSNMFMFQNSNSNIMEHLIFFNDHMNMILLLNMMFILIYFLKMMLNKKIDLSKNENNNIELFWTISPLIMLISISIPSMLILYLMEENSNPSMTLKSKGSQWYWSYEYPEISKEEIQSFMSIEKVNRILETNNPVILISKILTRNIITSNDVIHSWAIPSMGIKMDAIPGRLNVVYLLPKRIGLFYGQCSEICGMNHSFMPIKLNIISKSMFMN